MSATQGAGKPVQADADLELLSAWLDGELEPGQYNAVLERLKADPGLRAQFEWFNLAGDALRSHEVAACHLPGLVGHVSRALQAEPVRIAPGAMPGSKLRRHIATGITVAAAAGMLAVVALPQLRGPDGPAANPAPTPMASANRAVETAAPAPAPLATAALPAHSPQLDAYFRAHRELGATGVMPSAAAYIRMAGEPDR
jgi:negative regulator of sigma E activity